MGNNTDNDNGLPEADYEVKERAKGRVKIVVYPPNQRRAIQHGMKVEDIRDHPDGERAAIEERVKRIAARAESPDCDLDLPESGSAEYDPRAPEGNPERRP